MLPDNTSDLESYFEKIGALWKYNGKGIHAKTVLHSKNLDCYFNSDYVCDKPELIAKLCREYFIPFIKSKGMIPDWIVTYLPYGLILGEELAKQTGAKLAYFELGKPEDLNFKSNSGERVLVIADDIYGGGTMRDTIDLVSKKNVIVEEYIICFANMSNSQSIDEREIYSLIAPPVTMWVDEKDSPLPHNSVGLSARDNWTKLIDSK